jgi:hypothetical protein
MRASDRINRNTDSMHRLFQFRAVHQAVSDLRAFGQAKLSRQLNSGSVHGHFGSCRPDRPLPGLS